MSDDSQTTQVTIDAGSGEHANCLHCLDEFDSVLEEMRSARDDDVQDLHYSYSSDSHSPPVA